MLNKIIKTIIDRILKEFPSYGSIYVRFFFHDGRFVKYEFDKSETIVINEDKQNEK
jgi:hypothetical protein